MSVVIYLPTNKAVIPLLKAAFPDVAFTIAESPAEMISHLPEAEALILPNGQYTPEVSRAVKETAKRLSWIQFNTSGIDIAAKSGLPNNIAITNAAGANAVAVAEHAMALLMAVARRTNDAHVARTARTWPRREMMARQIGLEGLTLTLVGLGAIAREIAKRAKAFDLKVIAITRSTEPVPHVDELRPRERLAETAAVTDVLMPTGVYEASTRGIIDRKTIMALKPSAIFVNIARGQLVDEDALIEALETGRITGAGLDVAMIEPPDAASKLWTLPNVVMTPHSAGGGGIKIEKLAVIISANMKLWLAGKRLPAIANISAPD
jgi:phosphoglycerate dehydrogenase-like enzyme